MIHVGPICVPHLSAALCTQYRTALASSRFGVFEVAPAVLLRCCCGAAAVLLALLSRSCCCLCAAAGFLELVARRPIGLSRWAVSACWTSPVANRTPKTCQLRFLSCIRCDNLPSRIWACLQLVESCLGFCIQVAIDTRALPMQGALSSSQLANLW